MTTNVVAAVIAVMVHVGAAMADAVDYRFIITDGYDPAYESTNTCSVKTSAAKSLTSGSLPFIAVTSFTLESRFRTWRESAGRAINATKYRHFSITFR